jgi:hypothetical protein
MQRKESSENLILSIGEKQCWKETHCIFNKYTTLLCNLYHGELNLCHLVHSNRPINDKLFMHISSTRPLKSVLKVKGYQ